MAVFLMENGCLSMVNKTPVTILQETLQRRGLNPDYELIYDGTGTMDPIFKYQVSASGFTAIGEGKTKREAKHDAAAALLKRMNSTRAVTENCEVESVEEVDIVSPYARAIKENYVGMLDEVCVINKIPLPVFDSTSEAGPPHARVFAMECRVASIVETAIARTKKQAKQLVAQQMISRIVDILGDMYIPPGDKLNGDLEEIGNLKAIESGSFRHNMAIPISDMHDVFHKDNEEFPLPQIFTDLPSKPEEYYRLLEKPKEFLDEILQNMDGTCRITSTSKSDLQEALLEIDKYCERVRCSEEEDIGNEEEFDCSGEDENITTLSKILQEFYLEEDDHQSLHGDADEQSKHKLDSSTSKSEDLPVSNGTVQDVYNSKETKCLQNPIYIFLTIECPQGVWSFLEMAETQSEAINRASSKALLFLRQMADPIAGKTKSENEVENVRER